MRQGYLPVAHLSGGRVTLFCRPPVIMSDEVLTCRLMKIIILWWNQLYLNLDLFSWRQGGSAFIRCYSSPLAGAGRRISPPDTQFRRIAALKLWFWFNNSQYSFKTKISVNINCFYSILLLFTKNNLTVLRFNQFQILNKLSFYSISFS